MSTRAFVTMIDDKKNIVFSAFCPGDAYPSNLGVDVLDAISKGKFPELVETLRKENPEEDNTLEGLQRSWYIRGKDNQEDIFYDYAYEYEIGKAQLNLYHFGQKALTISEKEIPLFKGIFEVEEKIYDPLVLDTKTMTRKKDFYKEVRDMVRAGATLQDFNELADKAAPILYMDSGRLVDWVKHGLAGHDNFIKYVIDSGSKSKLKFIAENWGGKEYSLYVQTPFYRAPIPTPPMRTPSAVEKALANIIRIEPDAIRWSMILFSDLDQYQANIREIYDNDDIPLEKRDEMGAKIRNKMLENLEFFYSDKPIIGLKHSNLKREVSSISFDAYSCAKRRLEENSKPSLNDQVKAAEASKSSHENEKNEKSVSTEIDR